MTVQQSSGSDRRLKIETATLESVVNDIHAAPFWRRLIGDCIDLGLMLGIAALLWASPQLKPTDIVPAYYDQLDSWAVRLGEHPDSLLPWTMATVGVHFVLTYAARCICSASIGERLAGLSLMSESRDTLTFWQNVIHYILTMAGCLLGGLGYLWALFDRRRQTLANYGAATVLIIR